MRIAKNTELVLADAPTLRFLLVVDVMDGDVTLFRDGDTLISLALKDNDVMATLSYPDGRRAVLCGENARGKEVILTAGYARMGLYVGGALWDEDYFFTPMDYKDATVKAGSFMHFEAGYEYHSTEESAIVEHLTDALDGYALSGFHHTLSRPLPTVIGNRLYVMYLDERHGGCAKDGRGAHKLCAMFSDDGRVFHGAPIALGIDNLREEDFRDAALLRHGGRYYLYYIVKYPAATALSCAVSEDGFSYMKTGLDVEITGVENKSITSVSVADGDIPTLFFTTGDMAYAAKSIDLLRFDAPTPIDTPPVDKIIPLGDALYAHKDGALYRIEKGSLAPVKDTPAYAFPVCYGEKLTYIGVRNGAFDVKK